MRTWSAGGYGANRVPLDSIEEGDPATGGWKVVGSLPTARGNVACTVAGGKLYVAGGYNDPDGERIPLQNLGFWFKP